jgi:hypothetical protein
LDVLCAKIPEIVETDYVNGRACGMNEPERERFIVVTDLPEYSVFDRLKERDLFPTKSGNRDYQCTACTEETARAIALAMNVHHQTILENQLYEEGDEKGARECRKNVWKLCGFGKH